MFYKVCNFRYYKFSKFWSFFSIDAKQSNSANTIPGEMDTHQISELDLFDETINNVVYCATSHLLSKRRRIAENSVELNQERSDRFEESINRVISQASNRIESDKIEKKVGPLSKQFAFDDFVRLNRKNRNFNFDHFVDTVDQDVSCTSDLTQPNNIRKEVGILSDRFVSSDYSANLNSDRFNEAIDRVISRVRNLKQSNQIQEQVNNLSDQFVSLPYTVNLNSDCFDEAINRVISQTVDSNQSNKIHEVFDTLSSQFVPLNYTIDSVVELASSTQCLIERNREKVRQNMSALRKIEREKHGPLFLAAVTILDVEVYKLSPFKYKCKNCFAKHFAEEYKKQNKFFDEFFGCCKYGALIKLGDMIDHYPLELKSLFCKDHCLHENFMENIRILNSSFSVASLSCFRFKFSKSGPPIFKIFGQVYHKFNTVANSIGDDLPTNGQLYFVDTEASLNIRCKTHSECSNELFSIIEKIIRESYPFARAYMMMKEVVDEYNKNATDTDQEIPDVRLLFSLKDGFDKRRYNVPKTNEICAVIVCNSEDEVIPANIVVRLKGTKNLVNLYPLDSNVELMTYPLYYPNHSVSWSRGLKDSKNKNITLCDYVRYRLFIRDEVDCGKFIPHHFGKKLFQQWCVDQVTRVEWDRLNYIRLHQKEIQKCRYSALEEYLKQKAHKLGVDVGKQIVLPSSYSGAPRNMHEHFMDSMMIVKKTGKPTLFITMTCNPNDEDIIKCLNTGEYPNDRPDIVARVFKLKVDHLLEIIVKGEIFGEVIAYYWVIEFQKRGLPYMHLLVTLSPEFVLRTRDEIDNCIKAEIPDKTKDSRLFDLVTRFMLHGPCDKDAACWDNVKKICSKKFPKKFREQTEFNENGYPFYKRSNDGRFVYRKNFRLTNEFVVPYNVYLTKLFNCHINIEKVADIKAVKYLYKYIYKGYDAAIIECRNANNDNLLNYDEISSFLEARYIGPVEACWRLFNFPLQGKSHSVERLDVHLPNEQHMYVDYNCDEEEIREKMNKDSTLTAYFKFMSANPECKILYPDMPMYCTWNKTLGKWNFRKGYQKSFGRMYTVNPKQTDLYHERYLLLHVPAKSFSDLKTVDGKEYDNYSQACLARGLITNDDEWDHCLDEASHFRFPKALRSLYATILANCNPKYPEKLWEKYKDFLTDDLKKFYSSMSIAYSQCLFLINKKLLEQDKSLKDFKSMPQLSGCELNIAEDEIFDPDEEKLNATNMIEMMNDDQKSIICEIEDCLLNENQKCIFIDGPGGTGKSFVLNAIFHLFQAHKKTVCSMAFSGIAATILNYGRTMHNRFKFPLDLNSNSRSGIEKKSKDAREILNTNLFIIDEAPMSPKFCLDAIDLKLKELTNSQKIFGGKSIILSGDFRQILPIRRNATRSEVVSALIKNSSLWPNFKIFKLTKNMRADPSEQQFAADVLMIGDGTANDENDFVSVPDSCICTTNLVDEIFSDIFINHNYNELSHRAILSSFNVDVDRYNTECMEKFEGEFNSYYSIDETDTSSTFEITTEILNTLKSPSLPDHILLIKNNCPVMLLRNLGIWDGLCNGTRLQILDSQKYVLRCRIMSGHKAGNLCFLPRITLIEDKMFPFELRRHQFPIKPAFSFTINKSQAQTFKKVGIDFSKETFAHGQTYVAISRAKGWSGIKVKLDSNNITKKIKNVVWKEVLKY